MKWESRKEENPEYEGQIWRKFEVLTMKKLKHHYKRNRKAKKFAEFYIVAASEFFMRLNV